MRRKLPLIPLLVIAALSAAGVAAGANGGFTPVAPMSPNASRTETAYYLILGFTSFIFLLVESLLVLFVWKYRSRGRSREVEGAQVHGHTRLELIWTAGPVLILAVIAAFVFYELPGIANAPAASNPLRITVEGHQFYWRFDYPNGATSINELHVPVGRVVELRVVSADVIHSWWVPALGGKIQAIPGRTNHTWFQASAPGTYTGQCAELCGLYHASMTARVVAEPEADFQTYVSSTATATLGQQEFQGVCATCHGMQGQGGYGPAIAANPILTQPSSLSQLVHRGGRIAMPAVGNDWTDAQVAALEHYLKQHVYKGATSGG